MVEEASNVEVAPVMESESMAELNQFEDESPNNQEEKKNEPAVDEDSVAAGEAEQSVQIVQKEKKREIAQPKTVQRMPSALPDKKCFVKIVAIGDSGVGKTSLIQMFEHSRFTENFKPTIGADFSNKEITVEGKVVTLQIWDTAGQERYQSLGTAFYRGADCAFLVYDITNNWSFENINNWKDSFLQKSMVSMPESFPFMVVGNKLDIAEDDRAVETSDAQEYCDSNGMSFIETSARNNVNVEEAFRVLATEALKRQAEM